ncbi:hypothetical protein MJT46_015467 [Ovis ammon polii x Ovis aries]|nr:hypothetical protein MJT46_015467 [Ovis ammon polii x Ovis aries]
MCRNYRSHVLRVLNPTVFTYQQFVLIFSYFSVVENVLVKPMEMNISPLESSEIVVGFRKHWLNKVGVSADVSRVFNKNTSIIRKMDGTRRRGAFIMLKKDRRGLKNIQKKNRRFNGGNNPAVYSMKEGQRKECYEMVEQREKVVRGKSTRTTQQ